MHLLWERKSGPHEKYANLSSEALISRDQKESVCSQCGMTFGYFVERSYNFEQVTIIHWAC